MCDVTTASQEASVNTLGVALIGHSFMCKVHAHAWQTAPRFFDLEIYPRLVAVCGRDGTAGLGALSRTFVADRPIPSSSEGLSATATEDRGAVTVDDATVAISTTDRGVIATFEATRFATGCKNALRLELNGSRGSLAFDFERMNELEFSDATLPDGEAGFRKILVTDPGHPYIGAWWPAGHGLGYEHPFVHQITDFVADIVRGAASSPSFRDGLEVQRVLDAVERSAATGSAGRA